MRGRVCHRASPLERGSALAAIGYTTHGVSRSISEGTQPWLLVRRLKVKFIFTRVSLVLNFFRDFFLTSPLFCWQGSLWCRGKRLGSWKPAAPVFPAALFANAVVAWLRGSPPLEGEDPLRRGFAVSIAVCYKVTRSTVGDHSQLLEIQLSPEFSWHDTHSKPLSRHGVKPSILHHRPIFHGDFLGASGGGVVNSVGGKLFLLFIIFLFTVVFCPIRSLKSTRFHPLLNNFRMIKFCLVHRVYII